MRRLAISIGLVLICAVWLWQCRTIPQANTVYLPLRADSLRIMVYDGLQENPTLTNQFLKKLSQTGLTFDTTHRLDMLDVDSLRSYGLLAMWGVEGSNMPPRPRQEIDRYIQSGAGLLWLNSRITDTLSWSYMQDMLRPTSGEYWYHVASEKNYGPSQIWARDADGGRILRATIDSLSLQQDAYFNHLYEALSCAAADNRDGSRFIELPKLPAEENFTVEVLDDDINEPMELVVLPDGKVIFIERRGKMKLYDPETEETEVLHNFDVCTDGNYEDGLLGLALDPNFEKNHHLYLYYSPSSACDIGEQYLSKFVFYKDSLILASEKVVMKVPVQRETCCHSGGSIVFGPDGNLYLSTGDNTSSKESDGFTPTDERAGRGPFDAQKSSGNTHDLRGKILRIKPNKYGSYDIPDGNLFPKHGRDGRPEIYTMGCRNPFRISIDQQTGTLYWGDVGPDGGTDGRYGPRSYDEWNRTDGPGNFGWPYFVGRNFGYPDRNFELDLVGGMPDSTGPLNCSPNNFGAEVLPPAQASWIWYDYGVSEQFPQLGKGSRSAMAGPVFRKASYTDTLAQPFPDYFEGKVFIYEWARGWIKLVEFDEAGNMNEIEDFTLDFDLVKPIEMEFGPKGSLYILDYGKDYFLNNPKAKLVKISYTPNNVPPKVKAYANVTEPKLPATVYFNALESKDFDEMDSVLQYEWFINGQEQPDGIGGELCYTFDQPGVYHPKLLVIDHECDTVEETFELIIGNQAADIQLLQPANKTFYQPGKDMKYTFAISDEGGFDPARLEVNGGFIDEKALEASNFMDLLGAKNRAGAKLIYKSDCFSCHNVNDASVGPSYTEVAKRYQNQAGAKAMLVGKIIKGGGGNWGERLMAAHPDLSEEDAGKMVDYILGLSGEKKGMASKGTIEAGKPDTEAVLYLSAKYQDQGYNELPPVTSMQEWILRHPLMEVEQAERLDGMWRGSFGSKREFGQLYINAQGGSFELFPIDFNGIKAVRIKYRALENIALEVRLRDADGPIVGETTLTSSTEWREKVIPIAATTGIYPVFIGTKEKRPSREGIGTIDWVMWEF
ncbi:MAG: PQQ-dependent sugar dehydrogenase [Bacteroidota bacterium]